jgi:hypothetical protein
MQEPVVLFLIGLQPINGSHRETVGDGDDAQLVLSLAFAVDDDCGTGSTLVYGAQEGRFQFVGEAFQSLIVIW